jgi:hypothetical protein
VPPELLSMSSNAVISPSLAMRAVAPVVDGLRWERSAGHDPSAKDVV